MKWTKIKKWFQNQYKILTAPTSGQLYRQFNEEFSEMVSNMNSNEKPVAVVLPSWNPDEPRFKVEECPLCGEDRAFKNNKYVYNQRLGFAYSVDELVEVLNNTELEDKLENLTENIEKKIETAEPLQTPYHRLHYGDDKGYWRGYVEALKQIRKLL